MTQAPKIPDLLALQIIRDYGAESDYHKHKLTFGHDGNPFVFEILAKMSSTAPKQAWRKIERMAKRGLVAYGSSPRIPWLTDDGKFHLMQLQDPERYGSPPLRIKQPAFTYEEKSWSRKHAPAVVAVSQSKLELCTNCGSLPEYKVASLNPFSTKRQFVCQCGVRSPVVMALPHDLSHPYRGAVVLWNSLMHGIKRYGRKNRPVETLTVNDD